MIVKNDLYDYENRYIYQDSDFFKFSLDSILLAEFIDINKKSKNMLDLCAGNMAIPLILSKYTVAKITGFEIQQKVYELGLMSIKDNNLSSQLTLINDDVNNIKDYFKSDFFDVVICNPPFFNFDDKVTNLKEEQKIARHEILFSLEDTFKLAKYALKNNCPLYLVHRTNRIDEIIIYAYKHNINVKEIQFISTKKSKKPEIVLVKCIKNSKQGIIVRKEICIDGLKTYKSLFRE